MANIIVPSRRIWTQQPRDQQDISKEWLNRAPIFLVNPAVGQIDLVNGSPLVRNGSPTLFPHADGPLALKSVNSGTGYDGWRVPEVSSGSRSSLLYDVVAPPLTLITAQVVTGNSTGVLVRGNGSGHPAFLCGSWFGSNRGGYGKIRTTGGVLELGPGGALFDTDKRLSVTVLAIGPATTNLYSGLLGGNVLHNVSAATPGGNFYYETGDIYRCLSVSGSYLSAAPATALAGMFRAELSSAEASELIKNPWQIFQPRRRIAFFDLGAGGGSSLNGQASGSAQAAGSAALAAQVALAGVGVALAGGSAAAGVAVPLAAAGVAVADGAAGAQATITIAAAGLAQAAGQAGLSASVLLQAAGAAQAAGNAALAAQLNALAAGAAQASGTANLSGGAPGELSAAGGAVAGGQAVLSVAIQLQAAGAAVAGGSASGLASAPGSVSASGGAVAAGTALPVVTVSLAAAGFVQAMGAGQLVVSVNLTALGQAVAGGSANLGQPGADMTVDPKFIIRAAARNYLIAGAARNYHITRRAS